MNLIKISRLKSHVGLFLILLVYLGITGYTSWQSSLGNGPDEMAHFLYARFLHKAGYLPFSVEDRQVAGYKSDQPPLYAALVAALFRGGTLDAPPFVKLTYKVPRRHLVTDAGIDEVRVNSPQVLATEDPLAGEILFWRFGRWLSTLFGALMIGIIYSLALQVFGDFAQPRRWALAATASVAFIPTFIYISGVFSYESLVGLWLALYLWVAVRLLKKPEPAWLYLLAGLFIGLAMVTKLSALPAPLSLVALVLIVGYRAGWPKWRYLTRLALSGLGVFFTAGWWFILIQLKLNKVAESGWVAGLIQPILGDGSDTASLEAAYILSGGQIGSNIEFAVQATLWDWAEYLFRTFWSLRLKGPEIIFISLWLISGLIVLGLIRVWRQEPKARLWLGFLLFHTALFFGLPLIRFITTQLVNVAGQGHHILFPAMGAFAVFITWGLSKGWPAWLRRPWWAGLALGLALLSWNITAQVIQGFQPAHRPLPVRTTPPVAPPSAHPLGLDFGPKSLMGYELKGLTSEQGCCQANYPALGVYLYWQAKEAAPEDYRTVVSLVDSQDSSRTVWVGHAANGRFPNRAWEPGDNVREEAWLPLVGLPAGHYTLKLEVWGQQSPLTLPGGSTFTLGPVELTAVPPAPLAVPFQLWQTGQPVGPAAVFGSRSTVQITADPGDTLTLIGPDQAEHTPEKVAGQTHVFVIDPLWPGGPYQVWVNGRPAEAAAPALTVSQRKRQKNIPVSQVVVKANFANQIMLLGYNLPQRRLSPGQPLPLMLHWQALQTPPADFIMFTRLRDASGQVWGGYDRWPQEYYSPLLWVAGETIEDGFSVQVKPDTPPGLYYLDVGFYLPVGQSGTSLPLVQDGQMTDVTSVTLGPFKIGQITLPGLINHPTPQNPLNQSLGDPPNLTLLGYDLTQPSSPQSEIGQSSAASSSDANLHLTLYWRCESPPPVDYTIFVHLRNAAGETIAQKDQPPLNGAYPTGLWEPGEIISDTLTIPLAPDIPPGQYQLVVGLYDLQTGQRLIVPANPANEVKLTDVAIR